MPRREPEPVRITSASRPHSQDIKGRQKRYLISMGIRTLCFVLAVLTRTLFDGHWMMWVFLAGAVFLPYVAVVMANAGDQRDDGFQLPGGAGSPELTARERED